MAIGTEILGSFILLVILIPISALMLMISTKIFKIDDSSFKTAILIAAIAGAVSFVIRVLGSLIPVGVGTAIVSVLLIVVVCGVMLYLIKMKYVLDWGKAALVWLIWLVFYLVAALIVSSILAAILLAAGLMAL